jgi:transposase
MGYVQGEGRSQATLFPVTLEELIPDDHVCRVIDAFVARLDMAGLGFERAEAAETGRPGYDPRDLLKLYLYGYLQQIRSSRRLESECRRNIELMWLLGRLAPDHKTIAEFRRMHRRGVTAAGAELVRLARSVGLVKGEWVAIDGSKFQAVSSVKSVREREALERYLEQLERSDEQDEVVIDPSAVASALEKLQRHPEPEVGFMRTTQGFIPAYNVQAAVDAEHALIVAQQVTVQAGDNGSLQPMAEAAQAAAGGPTQPINVVADAGYSNGAQAAACEVKGILPHVPANRGVNSRGDGTLFDRTEFTYQPESDTFLCPVGQTLARKQLMRKDRAVLYAAQPEVCGACPLRSGMKNPAYEQIQARKVKARLRMLQHAQRVSGNVSQTCRFFGVSTALFYIWKKRSEKNGLACLRDQSWRPHQIRYRIPAEIVSLRATGRHPDAPLH